MPAPGMAAGKAPQSQQPAFERAVLFDRFKRIVRTARLKPAPMADERFECEAVEVDGKSSEIAINHHHPYSLLTIRHSLRQSIFHRRNRRVECEQR